MGEGLHGLICIEHHDELGNLDTGLKAEPGTPGTYGRRTAPAVLRACYNHSLHALAAENETGFDGSHDRQPLRILHDVCRYRLLGHLLEALQNRERLVAVI